MLAARCAIKVARGAKVNGLAHAIANVNHYDAAWDAANYAIELTSRQANHEGRLSVYPKANMELCHLLREIIGNPFHPTTRQPDWLAWNGGAVIGLAHAIYREHRFKDMPVLADALEEAGCTEEAILKHCREPGEHVRGCWVVDLVLGKE